MANFSSDGSTLISRSIPNIESHTNNYDFSELDHEFDIDNSCKWIDNNGFQKVCLQFPDELLNVSADVYEIMKGRVQADLYILADTTYSSCCVDVIAATHVNADAVVHYGHSCLSSSSIPVFISLPKCPLDVTSLIPTLSEFCNECDSEKVILFYDAAFNHVRADISDTWYNLYPKSYIAYVSKERCKENIVGRLVTAKGGTILTMEDIKDFTCLYIGTQSQTLFNCITSVKAKWYSLDPNNGVVNKLDETPWFKRRRFLIEKCRDAKTVGILVCKLSGQSTRDIIKRMKVLCKSCNKKSYIVSVGKPNVAKLANFPEIDVYVLIACPESDLYSSRDFYKPLIYPYELEVALNKNMPYTQNYYISNFEDLLSAIGELSPIDVEDEPDVSLISGNVRGVSSQFLGSRDTAIEKTPWLLDTIGQQLSDRSWTGLEQKLGETSVKEVEIGRKGLPIGYENEPKT